ncbi:MAG TPA: alkaline phosphatase family protein [Terriglobales bacterium]|nr:alkaline phosphatase family protein [Terriglobales bacterium]
MRFPWRVLVVSLITVGLLTTSFGSAYNARPKLIVIVAIDQFRGDYLERYRDQFGEGGFRLLLDHGAYFPDCNYDYANTRTAPGHATLGSGAYTNGHGIIANEWWDPQKKKTVTSVQDDATKIVGGDTSGPGSSPHNLQADTLGDELKLATQGKARVFGIALKDRAAILTNGFSADGAYWIDYKTGAWITSTYYRNDLPKWAQEFNSSQRAEKYFNREWKDASGNVLRSTTAGARGFYEVVGSTPFANDYEFEFARELITYERLGAGPATDLLTISLSANDILGHQVGPDSPEMEAMVLATDRQLADFFTFLGHQLGMANVWIALSADHGTAPLPATAAKWRIPAANLAASTLRKQMNTALSSRFGKQAEYVQTFDYPLAWLNDGAFTAARVKEDDAERAVGDAMKQVGIRAYYTKSQLAEFKTPATEEGERYAHSYSPLGGWYVMGVPAPFTVGTASGTDHASPYSYDTHVPLALYGLPFQAGTYHAHAEPVDLAVTLASVLGINAPTHASGRVLTEALAHHADNSSSPERVKPTKRNRAEDIKPASYIVNGDVR